MNRNRILALLGVGLVVAGCVALWVLTRDPEPTAADPRGDSRTQETPRPDPGPAGGEPALEPTAEPITDLASSIADWRELYGDQPRLTPEETIALRERREAAAEELAARIGASGAEIVPEVRAAIGAAERSREKLVLMGGLGANPSAEAVDALEDVFEVEDLFRLKEEALRQLGNSDGDGHIDLLIEQMLYSEDPALAQIAAAMLHGEAGALEALVKCVHGAQPVEVRLEAVHSIGGIGTDEARAALEAIAGSGELPERIRLYADKEIQRSFGG